MPNIVKRFCRAAVAVAGALALSASFAQAADKIVIGHSQPNLGWPYIAAVTNALQASAKTMDGVELVTLSADGDIARLIVLGVGMRTHTGVVRRMFGALAERGINISMINTSEVRVSAVVDRARGAEALACLKKAFNVP